MPVTTSTQGHTSHTLTGLNLDAPSGLHRYPEGLCVNLGPHTPHTAPLVGVNLGCALPPFITARLINNSLIALQVLSGNNRPHVFQICQQEVRHVPSVEGVRVCLYGLQSGSQAGPFEYLPLFVQRPCGWVDELPAETE